MPPTPGSPSRRQIWLAVITGGLLAAGFAVPREPERVSNGALVEQILARVQRSYIDPVPTARLNAIFHRGLNEMVQELDRNTRYVPPDGVLEFRGDTEGSYIGIGIVLDAGDGDFPTIGTVIHGGPAAQAGVREGDTLVAVDDEDIQAIGLAEITRRIKGRPGTQVRLRVDRAGLDYEFAVPRSKVGMASVSAVRLYEGAEPAARPVGYLRLTQFQDGSLEEIRQATTNLVEAGAKSLVLDLRSNGGGILEQAVDIARLFLEEGHVLTTRGRSDWDHPRLYTVDQPGPFTELALTLLVDGGTASSAEILAAALRDHHRALLIGNETYGKWTVQTIYPLGQDSVNGILKLTTRRHYPPKGFGIREDDETHQRRGLVPDVQIAMEDKTFTQLFRAWQREQLQRVNTPFAVDRLPLPSQGNTKTFPPSLKARASSGDEAEPLDQVEDGPLLTALALMVDLPRYWEQVATQRIRWASNPESVEVNTVIAKEDLQRPKAPEQQ